MVKQRNIPFGYEMRNGQIQLCPPEVEAVKLIYSSYLQGDSYLTIANIMSELKVRYHDVTTEWNKHMVKRILENEKYLGQGEYPTIISESVWQDVNTIRSGKTGHYKKQPLCVELVKRKIICGECGASFSKDTATNRSGNRWWNCSNPKCSCSMKMKDDALEESISTLLNRLIIQPELLDHHDHMEVPLSLEAVRIQNEIHRELSRSEFNEDYLSTMIFACAAEKYALLGNSIEQHSATGLKEKLHNRTIQTAFDSELFESTVKALLVTADNTISLQLVGGNILS